jgi:hypothetical protein
MLGSAQKLLGAGERQKVGVSHRTCSHNNRGLLADEATSDPSMKQQEGRHSEGARLDEVPEGYRAMNEREAIKVMVEV